MAGEATWDMQPIVVGVDGSDPSLKALEWAVRQAELTGAEVQAVTAWQWPASYGEPMPIAPGYDPEADAKGVLDEATARLQQAHPSVVIRTRVLEGSPAQVLVEASRGAGLLVVGNRGHGAFAGLLLGSVSEHCTTHAHCPVLVVRERRA